MQDTECHLSLQTAYNLWIEEIEEENIEHFSKEDFEKKKKYLEDKYRTIKQHQHTTGKLESN